MKVSYQDGFLKCDYCHAQEKMINGAFSNVGEFCAKHFSCEKNFIKQTKTADLLYFLEYIESSHAISYNWKEEEIAKLVKEYVEAE